MPCVDRSICYFIVNRSQYRAHYRSSECYARAVDDFQGIPVLVTGAASGIGCATARWFASRGARVTALDVDTALDEIAPAIGSVASVRVDVSDRTAVISALDEVEPPEVLVNCAGVDRPGWFLESDPRDWEFVLGVDLIGTLNTCHVLVPRMIAAHPSSAVVNVASDAARVGSSQQAVYAAAKGGVVSFSKALAREVARHQVSVNVVCPGPTRTELVERLSAENDRLASSLVRAVPMRRMGSVDEVAATIGFLGTRAARYITGQTLSVSGGLTMV